jgi:lysozyme
MIIDADGIRHIKQFEGCKLKAYWDRNGWATGYGQHNPSYNKDTVITQIQADTNLAETLVALSKDVSNVVKVTLNQGQFNVFVIFSYNIGFNAFQNSHLLSRLNSGYFASVPSELLRWIYSNGEIDSELKKRRQAEIDLWNEATQTNQERRET